MFSFRLQRRPQTTFKLFYFSHDAPGFTNLCSVILKKNIIYLIFAPNPFQFVSDSSKSTGHDSNMCLFNLNVNFLKPSLFINSFSLFFCRVSVWCLCDYCIYSKPDVALNSFGKRQSENFNTLVCLLHNMNKIKNCEAFTEQVQNVTFH